MKLIFTPWKRSRLVALALVMVCCGPGRSIAQIPDCTTGTVMYAIFNDSIGSTSGVNKSSEIRPVNYTTGAIGALMGGQKWLITKTLSGTPYYGSAGTGVDVVTKRFYAFTQMGGSGGGKDIVSINTLPPIVASSQVVIGTTPATLDKYHFVKVAVSPTGLGYAIGVAYDTTTFASNKANPIISFTTCGGSPTVGCSTITLLGYIAPGTFMNNWDLFNGDIAFNNAGDMLFATASYGKIGATFGKYKDARLFKILKTDIPSSAGSGTIPMAMVADYNTLDSTVINGIAMDPTGAMFVATRRYTGIQTSPPGPFKNELYKSSAPGSAVLIPGFAPITTGYSIADLASCYFPSVVLKKQEFTLAGSVSAGNSSLGWDIEDNADVVYFEIQRSEGSPDKFTTVNRLYPTQTTADNAAYKYLDNVSTLDGAVFYRVRKVLNTGFGIYSNIVTLYSGSEFHLTTKPRPNPVVSNLDMDLQLRVAGNVTVRLIDANGRMVRQQTTKQPAGLSTVHLDDLGPIQPGIYILELNAAGQSIKEKIVKR